VSPPCPSCTSRTLELTVETRATYVLSDPAGTPITDRADGDHFRSLRCITCGLTLVAEPGDGRLRRAYLMDKDGEELPMGLPSEFALWQAWHDTAAAAIEALS
jgi:hypothetical protein